MIEASAICLRDRAYSNFTDELLTRDIQPGQIVAQLELVELAGMPLGAIREMIPRLEADGLIKTISQLGLQILSINVEPVRNAYQLLTVIEAEAISEFLKAACGEEMKSLERQYLSLHDAADTAVCFEVLLTAQQNDWSFHDLIIERMENGLISKVYRVNAIKTRLMHTSDTRLLPELITPALNEHLKVITC